MVALLHACIWMDDVLKCYVCLLRMSFFIRFTSAFSFSKSDRKITGIYPLLSPYNSLCLTKKEKNYSTYWISWYSYSHVQWTYSFSFQRSWWLCLSIDRRITRERKGRPFPVVIQVCMHRDAAPRPLVWKMILFLIKEVFSIFCEKEVHRAITK
jgi:hypothetical protein